ncbi:hypothetical protein NON00_21065 [Roseomonas sp. GC11]|uniref:hypothetical protein n=1 Tax=Roseomonas sp. GC11 TaxID=2950546 RepID=UPI0021092DF6|nr:hypothetical protein [Roseomonas sp. GC11]MCQ4162407.1 hypothetical protein [Roseomonas sp. GC11]
MLPPPLTDPGGTGPRRFGAYEVEFHRRPGARRLVLAVTSQRSLAGPLTAFDFQAPLMKAGDHDLILLRDQSRSWYNAAEGWDALLDALRAFTAPHDEADILLVGHSMGAFGALLLAPLWPGARVVALGPSWSVDRVRHGRGAARATPWLDAAPALPRPQPQPVGDPRRYLLLFGAQEVLEVEAAWNFHRAGWENLFFCPEGGFHLYNHLTERGLWGRFIARMLEGAPASAIAAAAAAHRAFSHAPPFLLRKARRLLHDGDLTAAAPLLEDAAQAPGPQGATLPLLRALHLALQPLTPERLEALLSLPLPEVAQTLPGGLDAHWRSPDASSSGPAVRLGPVALLRLRGSGHATLRLRAEAPPGVTPALEIWRREAGRLVPLATSADPAAFLRLDLALPEGGAELILQRRGFSSAFDAERGEARSPWAMRVFLERH